jgi:O-antigen ligase
MNRSHSLTVGYPARFELDRPQMASVPAMVEERPSVARKLVELLFYLSVINASLQSVTGVNTIPYLTGGVIAVSGAIALVVLLSQGQGLPLTIWFAIAINAAANASLVLGLHVIPLVAEGLPPLLQWLFTLTMMCYMVRDRNTERRVLFFMVVLVIATISTSGITHGPQRSGRLALHDIGFLFANSNDLAHNASLLAVAVLFWSLRAAKILRPLLWVLALALTVIVVRTASRGGVLSMGCGLTLLVVAVLLGRGTRVAGIIMIGAVAVVIPFLAQELLRPIGVLSARMTQTDQSSESRMAVHSLDTLRDLSRTILAGQGPTYSRLSALNIHAHNSYVYTHMTYGGPAGILYASWLAVLGLRIFRMLRVGEFPMDIRLFVLAMFGMSLAAQLLSNMGYVFLSSVYAAGVVEKYTQVYGRRQMHTRRLYARQAGI